MDQSNVTAFLGGPDGSMTIPVALDKIECAPGLYSIFIDKPSELPEPFRSRLIANRTRLLYVGLASASLYKRLMEEELQHKRAATFFRSCGAALGYRPEPGSLRGKANRRNYKFAVDDTKRIIAWIEDHVTVKWLMLDVDEAIAVEPEVIARLCPIFNHKHNPQPCAELHHVRAQCRLIACS